MVRLNTLLFGFVLCFSAIVTRLFYWQVIMAETLSAKAASQYSVSQEIQAGRGQIFTSDSFPLVINQPAYLLYAQPQQIKKPEEVAAELASITGGEKEKLIQKLSRQDVVWAPLWRGLNEEKRGEIEKLAITGLGFEEEEKRAYPEGSLAAQLLGFVAQDKGGNPRGYFGLEGFYQRSLAGRPGRLTFEKDAAGRTILIGQASEEKVVLGEDLTLHLDRSLEFLIEEKLKKGIIRYGAKSASVVVLDPLTGGVLAMASFPSYDPANFVHFDDLFFTNPVVSQSFEPGSVFKVLVMAAAIEEKVVSPDDKCTSCAGPRQIGEYTIRTWNDRYFPDSTMNEVIQHSDNVGMVFVGEKLGMKKLVEYLKKFGLGERTGIDLEGEASPVLRPENSWSEIDRATACFGQGVAVTPIQMVRAVAALANGGKLLRPQVVAKIKKENKEIAIKPEVVRQVVSPTTARILTEMMVNATENGEAKWAKPAGFRIAGKTGTAQIPVAGHYDKEKTIASFVGFAPADNPKFVMLVTLREPSVSPWGSETAAPLWFDIAKGMFNYWGIPPS
jgi:cell division protein FtsI/penicillin-binding protein 2